MHVLVPLDGNAPAEAALEYALAAFPDAAVTAVCVVGVVDSAAAADQLPEDRRAEYDRAVADAEAVLDDAAARADGRQLTTEVIYGPPSEAIPDYAADVNADRIVMGEHGQAGASDILLGSVAENVVRNAPVPVTVVRGADAAGVEQQILVGVDGSPLSTAALREAVTAHDPDRVRVLTVVESDGDGPDDNAAAERLLETTIGAVDTEAADIETVVRDGDPADALVDAAATADHVVVGSHGRTGIDRLTLGSVAEAVVRNAPVTVTVVHERQVD
ncbi:UspA domain protein [Natronomonas pharaonis DSM 2160]|uniref:UspA domain protein n=1 Tax=Natronomonas pharaonis (strain ATCC 35678 / DSM 2160 / CIP 103997 / JCM 8858 / NBRC 14720 / NCIMB 2260 / Gabara) TaxID=348780 RepID=A0A1U7EVI8_NATPD|nr:universal stress protein [Natronomonas pharaonis]CAI49037.1 UspA domain protein [Natronomonas pharaonis DSM 2160]